LLVYDVLYSAAAAAVAALSRASRSK